MVGNDNVDLPLPDKFEELLVPRTVGAGVGTQIVVHEDALHTPPFDLGEVATTLA